MNNFIELKNLSKNFHGKKKINVLKNINYKFKKGKSYSLVGPSGSGKSTLLNILSLIDRPSKGSLIIDKQKINFDENKINFNEIEAKIIRKVFEWPKIIESASKKFDLHKIPFYLYELSTLFHAYWSKGNDDKRYKFIENEKIKRKEILAIINLVAIVIKNGMNILGVSLPDKM